MRYWKIMPGSSTETPTTSLTPCSRECSGGTTTTGSGAASAGTDSPLPATTTNPRKHNRGPDAKSTRIARLRFGNPRNGYRSVPVLHAPFPTGANLPARRCHSRPARIPELRIPLRYHAVHHTLFRLLDRALGPLHLHTQSSASRLARTPSALSRPEHERRSLPRRGRSA